MLTRFLAYLCFIMASCWLLFAGGLLVAAIRQEPQHFWLSTGLMLTVLLPTACTALYVHRTGFGRPGGAPMQGPPLSEPEQKLHDLQQAQRAFFTHIDLDQHLAQGGLRGAGPGNVPHDLPTPYPNVLDYRERQWAQVQLTPPAADEIQVKRDSWSEWEASNIVSFRLLTSWEQAGLVCAMCTHVPKRLAAADTPLLEIASDACLLLNPTYGFRKSELQTTSPAGVGDGASPP